MARPPGYGAAVTTTPTETTAAANQLDLMRGLAGATIAVGAWSAGTVLTKGIDMGSLAIGAYRFALFSVGIIIWLRLRGIRFGWRIMRESMWGGIALGADIALFFSAIKLTSIVNATVIGSMQPLVVAVVAARFFGERIRARDAAWSLVALTGAVVVVATTAGDELTDLRGDLLAAAAMLSWSAYFIASKRSRATLSPTEFTAGTAVWTALICAPMGVALGQDMSWPNLNQWVLLAALAFASGVLGHALINWSLVRIPLWIGSTFTLLIPVFSALLAWVFLGEAVEMVQWAGMAVVILALGAIVRNQSRPTP